MKNKLKLIVTELTYIFLSFRSKNKKIKTLVIKKEGDQLNVCWLYLHKCNFIESQMFITAKWSTISFMMISYATGLGFVITPALELLKRGEHVLPVKSYIPYSVSDLLPYLATYLQQFLALFYAVMLNVSFDCLVYGFTIQACAQIELMCCRLTDSLKNANNISSGRKSNTNASITECVRHHLLVSILVKKIRALFIWTVMIFFFFSLLIVCTSIFILSKVSQQRYFIYAQPWDIHLFLAEKTAKFWVSFNVPLSKWHATSTVLLLLVRKRTWIEGK